MSLTLMLLGVVAMLFLAVIALVYKNRADNKTHVAALQKTIVDALESRDLHRQRLDGQLNTLHEKQRHETIEANTHLADRSDFDNDWGGMSGDSAGDNAPDRRANPPGQAGAAADTGHRTRLHD